MNLLVKDIPYIEILLALTSIGLGSLGYFIVLHGKDQLIEKKYKSFGRWILGGLVGLAVLAMILLLVVALVQE